MATQTVIQETRLPEFQETFLADLLEQAGTVSETGMPFAPSQLADLSPAQQQAITAATSGVGSFAPFLQQGQQALQSGITGAAGANITPTSYQEYMDPFLEDVIQQQYSDIAEQGRMQQNQLGAQAVGSGAFGGSRQAIQAGEIDRNILEQQARTGSQLRTAGFAQAQQLAGQAAQQQLQQAQLQGALGQGIAGLGQLGQQLGVQDINTARSKCCTTKSVGTATASIPTGRVLIRHLPRCAGLAVNILYHHYTTTKLYVSVARTWNRGSWCCWRRRRLW